MSRHGSRSALHYGPRGGKQIERVPVVDPMVLRIMGLNPKNRHAEDGTKERKRPGKNVLEDLTVMQIRACMRFTTLKSGEIMEHYGIKPGRYKDIRDWVTYANLREPTETDVPEWAKDYAY